LRNGSAQDERGPANRLSPTPRHGRHAWHGLQVDEISSPGVLERRLRRWADPETVFARLCRSGPAAVWFDRGHADSAARSFIGLASSDRDLITLDPAGRHAQDVARSPAEELATALRARSAETLATSPVLGWCGWLSYELGRALHDLGDVDAQLAAFAFMDRGVVFDHDGRTVTLHVLGAAPDARSWLDATAEEIGAVASSPATPAIMPAPEPTWTWRHDHDEYLELIRRCQQVIARGDAYQLCLTNEITVDLRRPVDPLDVYRRLRSRMTTRFGGVIRIRDQWLISGSPELYLSVGPDGAASTKPMKGTRPRGADTGSDALLAAQLLDSEKERAENLMIVDLMRNDLSRVSKVGSVEVPRLFDVETYQSVHQMVSTVRSVLDVDAVSAMLALFPAGSMTGAPKRSAMQVLDQLEGGRRGVYSGVWGRLPLDGTAELAVVIRSLILTPGRATIGSGGGITALSDPEEEWREIVLKAGPMLFAIGGT
jgi:para-aminobenzoate synthetase component 1